MICIKINQNKNHFVSRSIGSEEWSDSVLKDFTKNHVQTKVLGKGL